jgi:hypothetical protein
VPSSLVQIPELVFELTARPHGSAVVGGRTRIRVPRRIELPASGRVGEFVQSSEEPDVRGQSRRGPRPEAVERVADPVDRVSDRDRIGDVSREPVHATPSMRTRTTRTAPLNRSARASIGLTRRLSLTR